LAIGLFTGELSLLQDTIATLSASRVNKTPLFIALIVFIVFFF